MYGDNLSLFDSKIACLCQSIEINNSKYVYRQSQVWMPNGSGVRWAECLLIIGTGCRVQVLAWSSIAQSVCQQAFSLLANRCLRPSGFESCLQQRKTTCLLSIRKSFACARASKVTTTNMSLWSLAFCFRIGFVDHLRKHLFKWTVWFILSKKGVFIRRFKLEVSRYRRFHYKGLALIPTWISNHM